MAYREPLMAGIPWVLHTINNGTVDAPADMVMRLAEVQHTWRSGCGGGCLAGYRLVYRTMARCRRHRGPWFGLWATRQQPQPPR